METDFSHESTQLSASGVSRRDFLKMGLGALSVITALEVGGAALLFLRARSQEGSFGEVITAGKVASFPPGSVTEFGRDAFFLIRAHDGGFLAVYRRCPHLGCTVEWEADKECFLCPCHASTFNFYGEYERAPVPRPLDLFTVRVENGEVLVDTSCLNRREAFSPAQLVYGDA
jgi:cytochrome b6-f complex iron-sulfur subunit